MYERQQQTRAAVASGREASTLFLLEHTPTISLGRRARKEHILADAETLGQAGIRCIETDRGGDVAYHGPGQLVAYPILDLRLWRPSVNWYIRALEETVIRLLRGYGLRGARMSGFTGVWVDGAKVAAIGIGLKHWVTWHGLALNVAPDEQHWRMIVPCGIRDKPVTCLARLLPETPSMDALAGRYIEAFRETFACETDTRHEP